jgi:hypothetical protein
MCQRHLSDRRRAIGLFRDPIAERAAKTVGGNVLTAHASEQHQQRHVRKSFPTITMKNVFVLFRGHHVPDDFYGTVSEGNAMLPSCLHSFSGYYPNTSIQIDLGPFSA